MISTHVYAAYLIGSPDVELQVMGGQITLDAHRIPHVTADLDVSASSASTLAILTAMDPRNTPPPRIRIEVDATRDEFPFAQSRTFDLGIRDRNVSHTEGVISLSLASDEALLEDYAPIADDDTPFGLAASLRDVVDYVLDTVIPGALLEASPTHDPDVTPRWPVTNLHTNPEVVNPYGYQAGTGASGVVRTDFMGGTARWDAAAGVSNLVFSPSVNTFHVTPGRWYVASIRVMSQVPTDARAAVQWWAAASGSPMGTEEGPLITTSDADLSTVYVIARAPVGAAYMVPFVSTLFNLGGTQHYARRPMVYEGDRLVQDFTGSSVDTADYLFDWAESVHGSPSVRTPVNDTPDPEALTWSAGVSGMDFLHPLLQSVGLRLVCDEARKWTLRDADYSAPGGVLIRVEEELMEGDDRISRETDFWFDARVTRYVWTDRDGIRQERIDAYAATTPHSRTTTVQVNTAYPGAGRSQYAVERTTLRSRVVSARAVANWDARAEQATTYSLPAPEIGDENHSGLSERVTFDLDTDEMVVTTNTQIGA